MSNKSSSSHSPLVYINVASELPIKLSGANYSSWARQFHSLVVGHGLFGYIDGTSLPPTDDVTSAAFQHWIRQDQLLFHAILASVQEETVAPLILTSPSARDAWLILKRLYARSSQSRVNELKEKLSRLARGKDESVLEFMTSLKRIANDLFIIGHPIDESQLVLRALDGVGAEFKDLVAAIRARDDTPISFFELFEELVEFETFLRREEVGDTTSVAVAPVVVCQYCDEPGHSAKTCQRIINPPQRFLTTGQITNAFKNMSFSKFYQNHNFNIYGDGSEMNFIRGTVMAIVLLLQPIVLLFKLLFGRRAQDAPQQLQAIDHSAIVPATVVADSEDRIKNGNNISQQSDDTGSASPSGPPAGSNSGDDDSILFPLPFAEYEVFLSFRGPDTRHQFTDILYRFLVRLKVRTFRDDDELRKGEGIWPSLVKAIGQSKIHVPVMSETYAHSKWCLMELSEIAKRRKQEKGHIVLPIFYMTNPRDVRHQTGPYQSAFQQHDRDFDSGTVQEWRDALNEIGALKGWHVKSKDEYESST
ncbi:unnamed protein product [Linum trigynum]|uniref:TIR domain-containing protein n=1 Tax=Linum trigynum TaxID=586398 RepID=A0AAV2DR85_9ROSI